MAVLGPPQGDPSDPSRRGSAHDAVFQRLVENAKDPNLQSTGEGSDSALTGNERKKNITLYKNGFTLDEGPLRTLDTPGMRSFSLSLSLCVSLIFINIY